MDKAPERDHPVYSAAKHLAQILGCLLFNFRALDYHNIPRKGGVILASNHQSLLDPILIGVGVRRPVSYMARESLFEKPFLAKVIRFFNTFPVKRDSLGLDALRQSVKMLKLGHMIIMFPEGTRGHGPEIGPLLPGVVMIAAKAGVPVVPVAIQGSHFSWTRGNRLWTARPVRLRFGKPMHIHGGSKEKLQGELQELRDTLIEMQRELQKVP